MPAVRAVEACRTYVLFRPLPMAASCGGGALLPHTANPEHTSQDSRPELRRVQTAQRSDIERSCCRGWPTLRVLDTWVPGSRYHPCRHCRPPSATAIVDRKLAPTRRRARRADSHRQPQASYVDEILGGCVTPGLDCACHAMIDRVAAVQAHMRCFASLLSSSRPHV